MRRLAPVLVFAGCLAGGGHASAPTPAEVVTRAGVAPAPPMPVGASETKPGPVLDRIDVVCARALRCGTIGRSQLEDCRKGPAASRLTLVWGYDPGLDPRARVAPTAPDPAAEQTCLALLASQPCRFDDQTLPEGCSTTRIDDAPRPTVAPGGVCTRWDDCIDGFCPAQIGCKARCKAFSGLGEACDEHRICGQDAYCWDGRCQLRADVGATCSGHWQWCKDGLFCDGYRPGIDGDHDYAPPTPGKCSAGKQLGEDCIPPTTSIRDVCSTGLYCDWGSDRPVCRSPGQAGDECRWDSACIDGLQCQGLGLGGVHPAGKMFAVRKPGECTPTLDAGDACDPRAFVSGCPTAMVCDVKRRVCRSTGHAGDPCASSWLTTPPPPDAPTRTDGCFGSHYCDIETRTCQLQRGRGERCTPQKFGVEDDPCFLGKCDAKKRRCVVECK